MHTRCASQVIDGGLPEQRAGSPYAVQNRWSGCGGGTLAETWFITHNNYWMELPHVRYLR